MGKDGGLPVFYVISLDVTGFDEVELFRLISFGFHQLLLVSISLA